MTELLIKICDKCLPDKQTRAVCEATFDVDGKSYQVDVCAEHDRELKALTEQLKAWTQIGRMITRKASRPPRQRRAREEAPPEETPAPADLSTPVERHPEAHVSDVRSWARDQGLEVADRGPITDEIMASFLASHPALSEAG